LVESNPGGGHRCSGHDEPVAAAHPVSRSSDLDRHVGEDPPGVAPREEDRMAQVTTQADTLGRPGVEGRRLLSGAASGVALAGLSTMVVYAVGNAGSPIRVVTGWEPDGANVTVAEVLITSAVSVSGGALLLRTMERRGAGIRVWTAIALGVAIVSAVPLWRLDVDTGSRMALTAMHALTGASAIIGHRIARLLANAGAAAPRAATN
jgi:Family of unknown function (DUF6069)